MKTIYLLLLAAILLSGCSSVVPVQPTTTSAPTLVPTQTPAPTAAATPTPFPSATPTKEATRLPTRDPLAQFLPANLPEKPDGFSWKKCASDVVILIPDGWFFKLEDREELKLEGCYVTREDIEEVGRFTTGASVLIYRDFQDNHEAEAYSVEILRQIASQPTMKQVIDAWDIPAGDRTVHHMRLSGEFPNEPDPAARSKTLHYASLSMNQAVYLIVFESPDSEWDQAFNTYGPILDRVVVIGKQ